MHEEPDVFDVASNDDLIGVEVSTGTTAVVDLSESLYMTLYAYFQYMRMHTEHKIHICYNRANINHATI